MTLHVTNGDAVAAKLLRVFDDPVSITADVLHEGPATALDGEAWREQRAHYLAAVGYTSATEAHSTLSRWDHQLTTAGEHEDVVLWFEHDLFDQLLLIRTLDLLHGLRGMARPRRVSLVCINTFLGHLTPLQLRGLWPTRAPVTDAQYAWAREGWRAFRQPHPADLIAAWQRMRGGRDSWTPLPFLGCALERFFEQFPSTRNGLSRTADAILQLLDRAPTLTGGDLFRRTQALEQRMFLGDSSFYVILRRLMSPVVPLVTFDTGGPGSGTVPDAALDDTAEIDLSAQLFTITAAGRAVVRGEADAVRLNGIDAWYGGVHLIGTEASWRWDPVHQTLLSCR